MLLGQHHAEEIFRSHIKKYGVSVELSTELVSLDQDADGVIAHVVRRDEDGNEVKETIRTPFLIGADGAKGLLGFVLSLWLR